MWISARSWLSSVPPCKFRDSTSTKARPFPFTSFSIQHSPIHPTICIAVEFNWSNLVTLKREAVRSTETSENLIPARFENPKWRQSFGFVHLKCPGRQFFFFDRSPFTEDEFLDKVTSFSSESVWQYGFVRSFFASTVWKDVEILLWNGRDWNFHRVYTNDSQFQSGFVHRCGRPASSSSSCSWRMFFLWIQAKVECAYEGPVSLSVCERPVKSVTRTPVQQILFGRARLAFFFHLVPCFLLFISLVFSLPSSKLSCGYRIIFIE